MVHEVDKDNDLGNEGNNYNNNNNGLTQFKHSIQKLYSIGRDAHWMLNCLIALKP